MLKELVKWYGRPLLAIIIALSVFAVEPFADYSQYVRADNPVELTNKRTEHSKIYYLGEEDGGKQRYAIESYIGIIHYKENYSDVNAPWLNIDTTINQYGGVTKAPYDLQVFLNTPGFYISGKEKGIYSVQLKQARSDTDGTIVSPDAKAKPIISGNKVIWPEYYPGVDIVITACNSGVSLQRIIKSSTSAREYDVAINELEKGVLRLLPVAPAIDASNQLIRMEEKPSSDGRTETLKLEVIPTHMSIPKPITYPIIDAVDVQVGDGADDGYSTSGGTFNNSEDLIGFGYSSGQRFDLFSRFLNITMSGTIDTAYIQLKRIGWANTPVGEIYADDTQTPTAPTSRVTHAAKTRTANSVNWAPSDPGANQWFTSPSIVDIIQELVDSYTYDGDDAVQILVDGNAHGSQEWVDSSSWDKSSSDAPKLVIEYTESGGEVDIENIPSSKTFGELFSGNTYWSSGSEPEWPLTDSDAYFTLVNTGNVTVNVSVNGTDPTGGVGATLVTGTPSTNEIRVFLFKEGDGSTDNITLITSNQEWITGLASSSNISWEIKVEVGPFTETPPVGKLFYVGLSASTP